MAYHRAATITLMLALALGVPATTAAQLPGSLTSPASASPCSEVCSGGGYGPVSGPSGTAGNPGPCSEVCSGGGYGPVSGPSGTAGNPGPCSEVCSGGGYGPVSRPS